MRIYRGHIIDLDLETIDLPNGERMELEIVRHPGGAAVVALDEHGQICLLRQYRHLAGGYVWELPAGKLDGGEPPATAAARELLEEAGLEARQWDPLGHEISSPGVFAEVVHLFLARGLASRTAAPERHELIEVHWRALDDALAMAARGEIVDAKTIIGLFRASALLAGARS